MNPELLALYDQRCFALSTAIKAVWLLFLRDKWNLLEEIGIDKETHLPLFTLFMFEFVGDDTRHRVRNQAETRALVLMAPKVLDGAISLSGKYAALMSPERIVA